MARIGHIALIRKIEQSFNARTLNEKLFLPNGDQTPQPTFRQSKGGLALHLCFCRQKIGKPFGLGQVDPAILQRTPGEFPRLGWATPLHPPQRVENRCHNRTTTMDMQFGQILARGAFGARKPERQAIIQRRAPNISKASINGLTRLWTASSEHIQ